MELSAIEIMALVLVAVSVVKVAVLLVKPKAWFQFAASLYRNTNAFSAIALLLAALALAYLIRELSIVQIFAASVFVFLLVAAAFAQYKDSLFDCLFRIIRSKNAVKKSWLLIVVWLALCAWVVWQIFF